MFQKHCFYDSTEWNEQNTPGRGGAKPASRSLVCAKLPAWESPIGRGHGDRSWQDINTSSPRVGGLVPQADAWCSGQVLGKGRLGGAGLQMGELRLVDGSLVREARAEARAGHRDA